MGAGHLIRVAREADIPRIIDLVAALAASVRGPQRVCRLRTGETLVDLLRDPQGAVFVSGGGFISGRIMQTVISPDRVALVCLRPQRIASPAGFRGMGGRAGGDPYQDERQRRRSAAHP